jgi:glycosyltransferase involved in cell wall biosynthesis
MNSTPRSSKTTPVLSIIVPTLNEAYRLPRLLRSLREQAFTDYELIVADANSTDGTRSIAKKGGARVVRGGLPSVGRNAGARVAKAPILLFLDADVEFEPDFLIRALTSFRSKRLGVAAIRMSFETKTWQFILATAFWNFYVFLTQRFRAQAAGWGTLVRASVHKRIGGFDENLQFAEDIHYSYRASLIASYGIVDATLTVSDRRFRGKKAWKTLRLYLAFGVRYFLRPSTAFRSADYEFGNHEEQQRTRPRRR